MNLTELYARRDEKQAALTLAHHLHATRPASFGAATTEKLEQTITTLRTELASVVGAISAMEAVEQSGSDQPIEAIEKDVVDVIRYASVVIGVGVDPDHPEHAFIGSTVRHTKPTALCPIQIAELLRSLADRFEAGHSHEHDGSGQ